MCCFVTRRQCDPSGCIVDLTIQLAIIMIGKQIVNNVKQIIIPYVFTLLQESRAVAGKPRVAAVNFDRYRVCIGSCLFCIIFIAS